jgi:hypothetical protein
MPHIRFEIKRLGNGDLIAGGASFALLIGIFLPWFGFGSPLTGNFTFDSTSLRSWMYLTFFITLAIIGYLVVKAMLADVRLPLEHWLILLGACGADLFLTFVCFATKPVGLHPGVVSGTSAIPTHVQCRTCGQPNPSTNRFCGSCGQTLHV